ncbi:MAG TPA: NUDIX domain-containing protein [Acidimicrobiales bacterium]|nr:NUDIX domain-containing protein [Acidimicrobiales bacterium]
MTFAAEPPVGAPAIDGTREIRALVAAHVPADERESSSRRRFLAELDRLPDPCSEAAGPVHVTASAIVVGRRGTVLHRHRRLGRWLQPGGHVEAGEDPAAAAIRETTEETGLAVAHPPDGPRLVHVDVHDGGRGHTHLDLRFLVVAPDADPAPGPGESPDVAWYDWDAAAAIADDALIGALRAAREAWEGGRSR